MLAYLHFALAKAQRNGEIQVGQFLIQQKNASQMGSIFLQVKSIFSFFFKQYFFNEFFDLNGNVAQRFHLIVFTSIAVIDI